MRKSTLTLYVISSIILWSNSLSAGQDLKSRIEFRLALLPREPFYSIYFEEKSSPPGYSSDHIFVRKRIELSNADIQSIQISKPPTQLNESWSIKIHFNRFGKKKFSKLTEEHVGELLAISVNDKVIQAPIILEPIPSGIAQMWRNVDALHYTS